MTTGVPAYSTTPANNVNANTGVNWDEGMNPGAVNNSARANMADLRGFANDLIWFQYGSGTSPVVTPAYASGTSFTVAGIDVTTSYHAGRRVKAVGSGTGTIYGSISSSSFSTNTTVNVTWDSGSLTNEALTIYLSQIPATGTPIPATSAIGTFLATPTVNNLAAALTDETGTFTPTDGSGAGLTLTTPVGFYRKGPGVVHVWGSYTMQVTANGSPAKIGALPFTAANLTTATGGFLGVVQFGGGGGTPGGAAPNWLVVQTNTTNAAVLYAGGTAITNANISGTSVHFFATYPI